jgi:predicted nucleic acid-binding protein
LNLVDSSGWLEYYAQGPNAAFFAPAIENDRELLVPTICIYEVYRQALRHADQGAALHAVAAMRRGNVVLLTERIALDAAEISLKEQLPMADSIILASARAVGATVWTQDSDFEGRDGVRYVRKLRLVRERSAVPTPARQKPPAVRPRRARVAR